MKKNKEEEPKEEVITASDLQMEQLTKLQQEATEFKEKYFLSLAELENTRKRLQKKSKR